MLLSAQDENLLASFKGGKFCDDYDLLARLLDYCMILLFDSEDVGQLLFDLLTAIKGFIVL
jgi:hypothetical protein